ncbi:MAG: PAS domain S-box protein, partial [Thermodesulfovibrionales bacterium]
MSGLSIKYRVSLFATILVAIGWVLFCLLVSENRQNTLKLSEEAKALNTSILITSFITTDLSFNDTRITDLLNRLSSGLPHITNISIYDREGRLKSSSITNPALTFNKDMLQTEKPIFNWNNLNLTAIYPFTINKGEDNTSQKYFLVIHYSGSHIENLIQQEKFYYMVISGFFAILFISIIFIISHLITAPIKRFSGILSKVTLNDTTTKIQNDYCGEYSELVENFNLMIDRLNEAQQEMRAYSKNLEDVIAIRTHRLNRLLDELNEQKEFFTNIINTIGVLIIVFDDKKKMVLFNNTAESILCFDRVEVINNHINDLMFFGNTEKELLNNYKADTGSITFESVINTFSGKQKIIIWQVTSSVTSDNKTFLIVSGTDITEKRKMEQFLIESQRFQSISSLLAGLSHNFNNILVGVLGYAGLIRIKLSSELPPERAEEYIRYINIIEQSAQKASDLIKHLRGFTKREDYHEEVINIHELIYLIRDIIQGVFPSNIRIEINLDEGLSPIYA